eukprot:scaffold2334_cov18-Tisochrysis_lutea.AAC.1
MAQLLSSFVAYALLTATLLCNCGRLLPFKHAAVVKHALAEAGALHSFFALFVLRNSLQACTHLLKLEPPSPRPISRLLSRRAMLGITHPLASGGRLEDRRDPWCAQAPASPLLTCSSPESKQMRLIMMRTKSFGLDDPRTWNWTHATMRIGECGALVACASH